MKFTCKILKADSEFKENVPDLNHLRAIHRYFNSYNWSGELEKPSQISTPTFEVLNDESSESISICAFSDISFNVFYRNRFRELGFDTLQMKLVEFAGVFSTLEVEEIITKFVQTPEQLQDYKLTKENQSNNLGTKEQIIGWLAYGGILSFLIFVEYKLISENGISKGSLIIFIIICFVLLIMFRFRPKKN